MLESDKKKRKKENYSNTNHVSSYNYKNHDFIFKNDSVNMSEKLTFVLLFFSLRKNIFQMCLHYKNRI